MHRPGVPEDLEPPHVLWARAATVAVAAPYNEHILDEEGLYFEGGGFSWWWRITLAPDGEAVFSGQDSDGSHTHLRDDPVDLLSGLPDRLSWPQLRADLRDRVLGYVYWYTGGAWHRVGYPDDVVDDGLAMSFDFLAGDERVVELLLAEGSGSPDADRTVTRFLTGARTRSLQPADVTALLTAVDPEAAADPKRQDAALDVARRAGLLSGSTAPLLGSTPAG
ncbi:hypothetical protein [Marinactinospora rubrisoli]|uniref:Uncharacterized protein n=1 Tax=Marinactinospora rubrisoli TaxID=2715399 RepID=A0ABW2KJW9_9ACTN